jgi:hypothetical protein
LNQARTEGVGATDFEDVGPAGQHLCDELATRERKYQMARVVLPDLIGHETKGRQAFFRGDLNAALILRFPCPS